MAHSVIRQDNHRVGYSELFFDLVFVFAITQLSHLLLDHYTALGAAQTALLFLTIWGGWIYSTWALNWLDPERVPVRFLLFALMVLGLFIAMALPEAFGARGLVFAACFAGFQLLRTAFAVWANRDAATLLRYTFTRTLVWHAGAAVFWVGGGLVDGPARFWLWLLALGLEEYLGPWIGYPVPGLGRDSSANWAVRADHMAERCALFVIICLGETLLVSGTTFAAEAWHAPGLGAFGATVLGSIAMWWIYFHIGQTRGVRHFEASDNPGHIARLSYTYAHIPIVAGIVLAAVGAERAIVHPGGPGDWAEAAALVGGPFLFVVGNGLFKWVSGRWFPLSHLVGIGLSIAVFAAAPWLSMLALAGLAAALLVVVAVWEHLSIGRPAPQPPAEAPAAETAR